MRLTEARFTGSQGANRNIYWTPNCGRCSKILHTGGSGFWYLVQPIETQPMMHCARSQTRKWWEPCSHHSVENNFSQTAGQQKYQDNHYDKSQSAAWVIAP